MNTTLIISGMLATFSPLIYLYKLSKKEVRPSILSWFGWSVLMGISIFSQVVSAGWSSGLAIVMVSASGCFIIAFSARYIFRHYAVEKKDMVYIYAGAGCVMIYFLFNNAWLTTVLAILADFMMAIPTLRAAYKNPEREKSLNWPLALSAWTLALFALCFNFSWINALWPLYLLSFNAAMVFFTYVRFKTQAAGEMMDTTNSPVGMMITADLEIESCKK